MATATQSNDIKFVTLIIAVVVVVLRRLIAALGASEARDFFYGACANGVVNSIVRLPRLGICFIEITRLLVFLPLVSSLFLSFRSVSIFRIGFPFALPATRSITVWQPVIFLEFIQRLLFTAFRACFLHKNASCRLVVRACV